ncbi:MAG: pyridoxal-phosphate dependent enzyme [Planctomycetota bacterium]
MTTAPSRSHAPTPASAPVFRSVLDMIGNTPMLELQRLETGPCRLFGKLELLNPAGSIKDRIGLTMIVAAEADGRLDPSGEPKPTIVEATAGNTGIGLALVAAQRGYALKVVMPDKMSQEKIMHLRAMGAQVVLTRSDVVKGHPDYYHEVAKRLADDTPNAIYISQFDNPANPDAHQAGTGPEIWEQVLAATGRPVDAVVLGVGTGGTATGCARFFAAQERDVKVILADPAGSILHPLINEGRHVEPGSWLVEGMGEDFVPDNCTIEAFDEAIPVTDAEAFHAARELLAREGLLAGSSTGCLIHAALTWCRRQSPRAGGEPLNVVTLICDSGAKYLSKCFNDYWMIDNGFIERESHHNLRDLIARRHALKEDYTSSPDEPLKQCFKSMQLNAVSQMAVLEKSTDRVVGIIDESDILLAVTHDPSAFERPVSDFMTSRLETIHPEASVNDLMPIFRADRVAIVAGEGGEYYGLITKSDLINYLRRQLP